MGCPASKETEQDSSSVLVFLVGERIRGNLAMTFTQPRRSLILLSVR